MHCNGGANRLDSFAMHRATRAILGLATVALIATEGPSVAAFQTAPAALAGGTGKLIVFGDVTLFLGKPGTPGNCVAAESLQARRTGRIPDDSDRP